MDATATFYGASHSYSADLKCEGNRGTRLEPHPENQDVILTYAIMYVYGCMYYLLGSRSIVRRARVGLRVQLVYAVLIVQEHMLYMYTSII